MIEVSSILFWGMAELLLVLLVVLLVVAVMTHLRKQQDKKAAQALIAHVKKGIEARSQEMEKTLENDYGYKDDKLEKAVKTIRKRELGFYKSLLAVYLKRDAKMLPHMRIVFEDTVAPYRNLDVAQAAVEEDESDSKVERTEFDALQKEHTEMAEEMRLTMDTMGRLLSEYSEMFSNEEIEAAETIPSVLDMQEQAGPEQQEEQGEIDAAVADEGGEVELEIDSGEAEIEIGEDISPDDLDDLFDGVQSESGKETQAEDDDSPLEQVATDEVAQTIEVEVADEDLSQDDLDDLFNDALGDSEDAAPAAAPSEPAAVAETAENLSQDDLEALLDDEQAVKQEKPQEERRAVPEDFGKAAVEVDELPPDLMEAENGDLSQDDLESLFDEVLNGTDADSKADPNAT